MTGKERDIKKNEIFIASKNKSKIADFKLYLGNNYKISTPEDVNVSLSIDEYLTSIEENALAKARSWCAITHKITIGDDTGFFIHELNGEPGVAIRRWAGELSENSTQEDFWKYLQQKTKNLNDFSCHFEQCVAIVSPNGQEFIVRNINNGILNKENLQKEYNGSDYPLGAVFESTDRNKNWDEMTDEEKIAFDKIFINNLNNAIESID